MATIDEIFAAMPDEDAATGRDYLVIDPVTRTITVPASESIFGVEGDEDAARKYFICPRYVGDNLDLASMFLTVYWRNANGEEDGYLVEDVEIQGDYVTFSWLLSKKSVAYKGALQFSVCADLPNTATKRRPDWNTTTATGEVLEGQHPDLGDVEAETSDVVTQLRAETAAQTATVEAAGTAQVDAVKAQGTDTTQQAVAAIQAQGEATVSSIPADYTALAATVDRLTRYRAAAIVCAAEGTAIQVQDASNDPLQGLRIFGKSTQAGTPTPDAPVEIVSTPAPVVRVCGKNLVKNGAVSQTLSGVAFTVNDDGSITVKGTATSSVYLGIDYDCENVHPGVKYHLSGCPAGGSGSTYRLYAQTIDGKVFAGDVGAGTTFTGTDGQWQVLFAVYTGTTVDLTVRPLLQLAPAADAVFEPYTGQTLTITTPGSLPGIPVASGGNYTDANGQQWIADEVDLARGVYVQRVKQLTLDGAEGWAANGREFYAAVADYSTTTGDAVQCLCSHYPAFSRYELSRNVDMDDFVGVSIRDNYIRLVDNISFNGDVSELVKWLQTTPAELAYILATPVETPLTDVELQAFRALHSCKPTTTVLNDAGAHMALEYAADPKTYIDNKLAALVAANS